jgi:hypothetical protein
MSDSTTRDGGPAYPTAYQHTLDSGIVCADKGGMSLRDYFAAQAIDRMICKCEDQDGGWDPAAVAAGCYELADAMLEHRNADNADLDPRTPEYGVGS